MTLPQNHPLSPIKIDPSNVVVSTSNWRNLQFLISKYLINQNGTIWGALVIWKNYLDKKFEGVEECYICFSILQGATHDIPKLCCHTCRKKFHSHCLVSSFIFLKSNYNINNIFPPFFFSLNGSAPVTNPHALFAVICFKNVI